MRAELTKMLIQDRGFNAGASRPAVVAAMSPPALPAELCC